MFLRSPWCSHAALAIPFSSSPPILDSSRSFVLVRSAASLSNVVCKGNSQGQFYQYDRLQLQGNQRYNSAHYVTFPLVSPIATAATTQLFFIEFGDDKRRDQRTYRSKGQQESSGANIGSIHIVNSARGSVVFNVQCSQEACLDISTLTDATYHPCVPKLRTVVVCRRRFCAGTHQEQNPMDTWCIIQRVDHEPAYRPQKSTAIASSVNFSRCTATTLHDFL
jgi:hypothetical protein